MVDLGAERERRLSMGVMFKGRLYAAGYGERYNLMNTAALAMLKISEGAQQGDLRWFDPDNDFFWVALDGTQVYMDAYTLVALANTVSQYETEMVRAHYTLRSMDPFPEDYTADKYWPPLSQ